jgi:DNA processing protein
MNQEIFYAMALTRLTNFNFQMALELYKAAGSAQALYEHRNDVGDLIDDCSPRLLTALKDWGDAMKRTEAEVKYMEEHQIRAFSLFDDDYPQRMLDCVDAPLVLYYKGNADLNQQRIISIVGTRHITSYGEDLTRKFISELHEMCPHVLIVSGLAYGVDICAHRHALANGYPTLGVLAHGLDQIYPYHHRDTAAEMIQHGGLMTEFMTQTNADKVNFVRRNRIVAGCADATIVIESAAKGGSLITAEIAQSYSRPVFAFPGNVGRPYSEGCNQLVRNNGAALITCAADFVEAMGWEDDTLRRRVLHAGIERQLFPELTDEEQRIVDLLQLSNDLQASVISVNVNLTISQVTSVLFQLELKGVVKAMAGGMYHLLM